MGRSRAKTKTGRNLPGVKAELKAAGAEKSEPTVPKLLQKCQELLTRCEYELANKFIDRVLSQSPGNAEALEYRGVVQIETGDIDAARETFTVLLATHADSKAHYPPPSAHLYLAQLSEEDPRQAITHYQTAVDILVNQLKGKERADILEGGGVTSGSLQEDEAKRTAIRALVSMVEIYMTDLCFEPEAESQCESYLNIALQLDPTSPEALQSLASVRISQSRQAEAEELVQRAWNGWRDANEDDSRSASPVVLLSLARIFIELGLYSQTLEILQAVFVADDEEVEAWYLQGWCFVLMAQQVKESGQKLEDLSWQELAQDARDCLETCSSFHTVQEHPDNALLEHVQELVAELEATGIHPTPPDAAQDDEPSADGENEEWTDDEDDVDVEGDDIEMGS